MESYQTIIYKIADVRIQMNTPWKENVSKAFRPFVEDTLGFDWQVKFLPVQKMEEMAEEPLFCNDVLKVYQKSSKIFVRQFHNDRVDGTPYMTTRTDAEKKLVTVEYLPEMLERYGSAKLDFFCISLEKLLMEENAMILHAACVDTPYGGIIFSGVSGAGKSTQAELWCSHGRGRLINGDRPILKRTAEGWKSYGSPYAGSSGCHLSESCRIRAIVLPKKSERCRLRKVAGAECFRKILGNLTVNMWDKDFVAKAGDMALQLISEVPVYELECTKEKEAVLVLQELLEKESERWSRIE